MAMINLTTTIPNTLDISGLRKWEVLEATDHSREEIPFLNVVIRVCGPGVGDANPYGDYSLNIYDSQASSVLGVDPSPQSYQDMLKITQVSLSGTSYTTYSAAFWANVTGTGTVAKHIAALQALILSKAGATDGIVSAAFAGA
jgi:hypothetical protein